MTKIRNARPARAGADARLTAHQQPRTVSNVQAHDLLRELDERGEDALRPVLLVLGDEAFLSDEVVRRLRKTTAIGGIDGFNEDRFVAGESHVDSVLAAVRN